MIHTDTMGRNLSGLSLAALFAVLAVVAMPDVTRAAASEPQADEVVNCLVPGQVRRLGSDTAYLTPRHRVETSAKGCEQRGGETGQPGQDQYTS